MLALHCSSTLAGVSALSTRQGTVKSAGRLLAVIKSNTAFSRCRPFTSKYVPSASSCTYKNEVCSQPMVVILSLSSSILGTWRPRCCRSAIAVANTLELDRDPASATGCSIYTSYSLPLPSSRLSFPHVYISRTFLGYGKTISSIVFTGAFPSRCSVSMRVCCVCACACRRVCVRVCGYDCVCV